MTETLQNKIDAICNKDIREYSIPVNMAQKHLDKAIQELREEIKSIEGHYAGIGHTEFISKQKVLALIGEKK